MNALTIALSAIRKRAWQSALTLVLFITGVAVATAVLLFGTQAGAQLERTTKGIDLVVGAKGSPLQLILCNVFHLDYPTGNIRLVDAERIARHRLVKASLPLALGDSWNGYRIVGSTQGYREWYELELKEGQWWSAPMEVVIGADVAAKAGLSVGSTFSSAHGLTEEGEVHGEVSYKVTGILQPTGTRQDQLILTGIR
ncbi:MAG: ABC transporter permease, partial [Bacteroidota bacterium]